MDSNLGNIQLKFNKYDKAIFHLLESIENSEDYSRIENLFENMSIEEILENKSKRKCNFIIE